MRSAVIFVVVGISLPILDASINRSNKIINKTQSTPPPKTLENDFQLKNNTNSTSSIAKFISSSFKVNHTKEVLDSKHKHSVAVSDVEIIVNGQTGYSNRNPRKYKELDLLQDSVKDKPSSELFSSTAPKAREDWERIVGGTKAANGSIPYQVSLRVYGVWHFCGASLVTPRVILTAAHCVDRMKPEFFKAVVGTNQLRAGGDAYSIRKIVVHKDYDDYIIKNDIAILFTEEEIDFGSKVDAVELNDEPVEKGEELLLTGWGTTSYPGRLPNDLMQLELRSITYEECKEAHQSINAVFETQICAMTKAGEGACHGDSGGPLVREGRQIGIVSWGIPCARGKPDVYTKVEAYMRWIEQTLYDDDEDHLKYLQSHRRRKTNRHRSFNSVV